jgi:ketosteroid isomerase-like protein
MSKAEDLATFKKMAEDYGRALKSGDVARIKSCWTDDLIVMPPNEPILTGKEAFGSWMQNFFDRFIIQETLSPEEVETAGDWAFVRSSFTDVLIPKAGGEPIEDSGKSLDIYKRQPDGSWKLYRAMWNGNRAAS